MFIENNKIVIKFDEKTGSLVYLKDKLNDIIYCHMDDNIQNSRLFQIMVPTQRWHGRTAYSHSSPPPEVKKDGNNLEFIFSKIYAANKDTGISAKVKIWLEENNDELFFSLELSNKGKEEIIESVFPILSGYKGISENGQDVMTLGGVTTIDPCLFPIKSNFYLPYARFQQRAAYQNAGSAMYCPWVDLSHNDGGLSLINYTESARNVGFMLENLAGYDKGLNLSFGWIHFLHIKPGQMWKSPPIAISLHNGDWHNTADRYNLWVDKWYKPAPTSENARKSIGFQNIIFNSFDGTPVRSLEEIPKVAEIGRKYGIDHLCVWDYMLLGNYAKIDDLDLLDYTQFDLEIIKNGVQKAIQEGSNLSALLNLRLINPNSTQFRKEGFSQVCRDYSGSMYYEKWSGTVSGADKWGKHIGPVCHPCDPRVESFRRRVKQHIKDFLNVGFTSVFYDQPTQVPPSYNAVADYLPDEGPSAMLTLLEEIRDMVKDNNADGLMLGEEGDIFMSQAIDLWMTWNQDEQRRIKISYSIPQTINSWVLYDPNDLTSASRAFAMGMQLCMMFNGGEVTLDDIPKMAEHIKKLANLRRNSPVQYLYGRFKDKYGLSISSNSENSRIYVFDSIYGPAVTFSASSEKADISVSLDRSKFKESKEHMSYLYLLDGMIKNIDREDTLKLELNPYDVAIWIP